VGTQLVILGAGEWVVGGVGWRRGGDGRRWMFGGVVAADVGVDGKSEMAFGFRRHHRLRYRRLGGRFGRVVVGRLKVLVGSERGYLRGLCGGWSLCSRGRFRVRRVEAVVVIEMCGDQAIGDVVARCIVEHSRAVELALAETV